jgi:outer membrane protein OmpA-like peptidoglycan-associated protein
MRLSSCSPCSRHSRRLSFGGVAPILITLVALIISALVFFFFTRPAMEKKTAEAEAAKTTTQTTSPAKAETPVATTPTGQPTPAPASTPDKPKAAPAPAPSFGFARPLDVGKEMLRGLTAGEFEKIGSMAAASDPTQATTATGIFQRLMKDLGAKMGTEDQVELLGMVENKTRIVIPFTLPNQPSPLRLQLDLERDERMGWKITRLELPKEAAAALATKTEPAMAAATPAPTATVDPIKPSATPAPSPTMPATTAAAKSDSKSLFAISQGDDALTFGSDFVHALLKHDFIAARKFVDEKKVPAERLAGLCIVFEEGQYEFKPTKPLIITVANPEVSWIIAQVQSQSLQQSTEFGLELQRSGLDQPWRVVGLNLSEILSSFANSTSKLGVPYTPIVKNPKGGESLALYFEYDQAELHPRAQKQLEIVAGLLKSDPTKKLHIEGHTDDKGTDDYNLQLSRSRAETVKRQLGALGVAQEQIVTVALGKAQPLSPNQKADGTDDPEGRSKNRRAEIFLDF